MLKAVSVPRVSERVHSNAVSLLIFFDLSSSKSVAGSSVNCDHEQSFGSDLDFKEGRKRRGWEGKAL